MSEPAGEWRIPPGATPVREGPDGLWVVCPEEDAEGYTWLPADRGESQ